MLHDNRFRWLTNMSCDGAALELAANYVIFPCGLIRGALSSLGVRCIVTAEISTLPSCKFNSSK